MNRTILLITSFLIGVVSSFAQAAFRTSMDQQGLCKLDLDAHELARQSLDMGTRCDAAL